MPVSTSNGDTFSNSLPFKISPKKFKYFGIWITDKHQGLYAANYQPLLSNLNQDIEKEKKNQDIERWGPPASLFG